MKRIGIFGGSFDPIHAGHLIVADMAMRQCSLEMVVFIPARQSPHKPGTIYAAAHHRVAMVKAAIKGHPGFMLDDIELRREGLSYTIDTVRAVEEEYPDARLYLILGSDNIRSFRSWKDPQQISRMVRILVYTRWGHEVKPGILSRWNATRLKGPEIFISSTAVRERRMSGRTIRHLVPPNVERYIKRHSLYQRSKRGK